MLIRNLLYCICIKTIKIRQTKKYEKMLKIYRDTFFIMHNKYNFVEKNPQTISSFEDLLQSQTKIPNLIGALKENEGMSTNCRSRDNLV